MFFRYEEQENLLILGEFKTNQIMDFVSITNI